MLEIYGTYFPSGSSRAEEARLFVSDILSPDVEVELRSGAKASKQIVEISDRIGAVDRQITMADGSLFSSPDNDQIDQIDCLRRGFFSRVASLETFSPRLIGFLVVCVLLIAGIVRYGLPVMAAGAAWATPTAVTEIMDTSTLSTIDRLFTSPTKLNQERQAELTTRFDELTEHQENPSRFKLLFRNGGSIGPNAFALPGGTVVFTDQLIELGTDEEIQAVMAHEIAHVTHRHGLKQLYRALGFSGLIALVGGDFTGVAEQVLGGAGVLLAMNSSRQMELEADRDAVHIMKEARLDPNALATMLKKLEATVCEGAEKACEETGWLSSHPGGIERHLALKKAIRSSR